MYKNPFFLLSSINVRPFILQKKLVSFNKQSFADCFNRTLRHLNRPPCPLKEYLKRAGSVLDFERAGLSYLPTFQAG
jgi:hypothetical protein